MNEEEPMTFMMLPNDLVFNCLARVSRLYYPILSLVSKRLCSLLASAELYQTRTLLGRTESCLYVCLKLHRYDSPQRWFTLCRKPNSSKKVLVPITSHDSPCTYQTDFARVGSNIYAIGGFINDDKPSSRVMVMDCRSHTWREAPSMQVARATPSACVLDGKIYVTGRCKNLNVNNFMEIFDTKTQTWEFESSGTSEKICSDSSFQSIACDGNVYVKNYAKCETYKLNKGRWRAGDLAMNYSMWLYISSSCVIENVIYSYSCGIIEWYDFETKHWKRLEGLDGFDQFFRLPRNNDAKVANYGGKLVVLCEDNEFVDEFHHDRMILCVEIALEKRQDGNIWGTIESSNVVSITNEAYYVSHVLAATL